MRKPGNHSCRLMPVILLLGLTCALLPDYLWQHGVFAQDSILQVTNESWSVTGSLNTKRLGHTVTLLPNGKVLAAGGFGQIALDSAEIYDPTTGTWHYTGRLNIARAGHTATMLPNGKVLIAGGAIGPGGYLSSAELYDSATGTWSTTGRLNSARMSHTTTLLPNGKVLVVGGHTAENSAELYDPVTERWNTVPHPYTARFEHTATLLPNGKVLVIGGRVLGGDDSSRKSAELYDPATATWSNAGNLNTERAAHMAVLLPNDKVLVMGGFNELAPNDNAIPINSAELYDPATGNWSVTGNLNLARFGGTATRLLNGKVLVGGGGGPEMYDPVSGIWHVVALPNQRIDPGFTATLLPNGKVLFTSDGVSELFDPGPSESETVASVSAASYRATWLASEAIAASFGENLAVATQGAMALPLPTSLAGTTVKVKDSARIERLAPLFFVSPNQVNYQIPPGMSAGMAEVTITSGDGIISSGVTTIQAVAPGLFTANSDGQGVASALALRIKTDNSRHFEEIVQFDAAQNKFVARPLDLGPEGEQVYLLLFGTGIRRRNSLSSVIVTIGSAYAKVDFAGACDDFVGLDQVNVLVPRSLAARGEAEVLLTVEAQMANSVLVNIK